MKVQLRTWQWVGLFMTCVCISVGSGQIQHPPQSSGENPSVVRFQTFPPPPPQSFQHINFFGPLSPPGQQVGQATDNGSGSSRRPFSFPTESGKTLAQQPGVNDFRFGNSGPFFFEHPPKHGGVQSCAGCIVPGDAHHSSGSPQRQPFPQRQPAAENGFQQQQPQQQSAFRPIEPVRDHQQQVPSRQQQQPQPQQFLSTFTGLREQQPIRQQPPFSPPPSASGFRPSSEESRGQQPAKPQQEFIPSSGSLGPPRTNANQQQQQQPPPSTFSAPVPRVPSAQSPQNSREVVRQSTEINPSSQELLKITKQAAPPATATSTRPVSEFRPSPQVSEQVGKTRGSIESNEERLATDRPRSQTGVSGESLEVPSGRRVAAVVAGSGSNLELVDDDSDSSTVVTSPSQLRGKLRFTPIVVDSAETHLSTPFPSRSRGTVAPLRPPVQPLQSTSGEVQSGSAEVDDDKTAAIIGSLFTSLAVPSSADSKFGGRKPSIQGERSRLSTPAKDESVPTSSVAPVLLSTGAPFKSPNPSRNPSAVRINGNARLKFNAQLEGGLNKPNNNGNHQHPRKLLRRPVRPQPAQDDGPTATRSTARITTTTEPVTTSTIASIERVEDTSDTLLTGDNSQELVASNQSQALLSTVDQLTDEPVASSEPSAEIDSSTAVDDEVALLELLEASREHQSAEVDDESSLLSSGESQAEDADHQKEEDQELDSQSQSPSSSQSPVDNKGTEQSTSPVAAAVFDKDPIELLNSSESADTDADVRLKETTGPKPKLEFFNLDSNTSKSVVDLSKVVFVPNLDLFRPTPRNTDGASTSFQTSRNITEVQISTAEHNVVTESGTATGSASTSSGSDRQSKAIISGDALSEQSLTKQKSKENDTAVDPLEDKVATDAIESSIDQLDFFQSELSSKHLANSFHRNEQSGSVGPSTDGSPPTNQSTTPTVTFERPRRPFDFLNKVRESNSSLSSTTSSVDSPTSDVVAPAEITTLTPSAEPVEAAVTSPTAEATTTKAKSLLDQLLSKISFKDSLDSLLPPGFVMAAENDDKPETTVTDSTTTSDVSDKRLEIHQVDDISSLLPPGFESSSSGVNITQTTPPSSPSQSPSSSNKGGIESLLEAAVFDDISSLLPPGFKQHLYTPSPSKVTTESPDTVSSPPSDESTTTKKWLVFPTRPAPARTTTSEKPKPRGPPPPAVTIKSGWPVRATTEFTGWPSPPTPAYSSTERTTKPSTTSTTTTTTTTTTTPRVTTVGYCGAQCRLAATVRLIDGVEWVPELTDHNTREFLELASILKEELDTVYQSGLLAPFYDSIEIEAFSRGSVLVDYYLLLNGTADMDTNDIRSYFHMSLDQQGEELKLGNFTVDAKSTDFTVVRQSVFTSSNEKIVNNAVSEWIIAVIVVGLASLMFVIAFGTTVLIRRRRQHQKRKSVPLTEEMLNELNKSHMSGVDNLASDSFYDVGDAWERPTFPSKPIKPLPRPASVSAIRSHSSYNNFRPGLHDTWKSEWNNGYYYNSHYLSATRAGGTAPRPSSHYGRYSAASYGRPRPTFDEDF